MKVLFCVHDFPPEFTGGVERAAEVLGLELARRGHAVHVLAGSTTRRAADAEPALLRTVHVDGDAAVIVHRWRAGGEWEDPIDAHDPVCGAFFEELLAQLEPDVVHVHHWLRLTNDLVAIAARAGVPVVGTLHDHWSSCGRFFRLPDDATFCEAEQSIESCGPCLARIWPAEAGELEHSVRMRIGTLAQELELAHAWTVSSARHRDEILRLARVPEAVGERVRVLPMGLGAGASPSAGRFTPRGRDQRVVFAHWGNLAAIKGVEQLVMAAHAAPRAARIELRLIGGAVDGALLERVRAIAGPAKIVIAGSYRPADLPELVREADVAVFPSLARETHSLVVDEALDLGLPLVVSDRGAMVDRVGGRGVIVPAGDVAALARVLDALVDDDQRAALASAPQPGRTDRATWVDGLEELYAEAAAARRRVVPRDFTRDRLAFRNARLGEIARFLGATEASRRSVEGALAGSREDLERLRSERPELAERIAGLLGPERGEDA